MRPLFTALYRLLFLGLLLILAIYVALWALDRAQAGRGFLLERLVGGLFMEEAPPLCSDPQSRLIGKLYTDRSTWHTVCRDGDCCRLKPWE